MVVFGMASSLFAGVVFKNIGIGSADVQATARRKCGKRGSRSKSRIFLPANTWPPPWPSLFSRFTVDPCRTVPHEKKAEGPSEGSGESPEKVEKVGETMR
jgi:hypothetical protein